MSDSLRLINARIPGYDGPQQVEISPNRHITSVQGMATPIPTGPSLDLAGDWLTLGGVDLQINGALGLAFPDLQPHHLDQLTAIGQFLWAEGVDAYLPTLVTSAVESIHQALATLATWSRHPNQAETAQIWGAHLEGPFLNASKRGAHPAEYLLPLTLDQVKRVLGDQAQQVRIITLAPELDASGTVIPVLQSLGITVSLGHSQATAAEAEAAYKQGASMVTHAFNAMPSLHHRTPGLLGAALVHPGVHCGFIADGQHVCPTMLDLLLRTSRGSLTQPGLGGLFLVSDALSPLGLPDGTYAWDSRQIQVTDGTARLPDGTLAGTTRPLLAGVQNLVRWGLCSVEEAIALATDAPRRAIGLPGFGPGQPASLLRWHLQSDGRSLTWQRLALPEQVG